jgi:hypothetical protein
MAGGGAAEYGKTMRNLTPRVKISGSGSASGNHVPSSAAVQTSATNQASCWAGEMIAGLVAGLVMAF